jgi:hypothetical protein
MADRKAIALIAVAVFVIGGVVVVVENRGHPPSTVENGGIVTGSAPVVRTDLATTTQVNGTLGYANAYLIANQASGVYTVLPIPGQVVHAGEALYEVDGRPIVLFYGSRPAWRSLASGVPDGPDVAQLKQNLGVQPVNEHFDAATTTAVRHWQAGLHVPVTGMVGLGDVVYAPGPIRVTAVQVFLGDEARPGTLLHASGTDQIVNLSVPVAQEYLTHTGDAVTVTLPDGTTTVAGTITSVSAVAASGGNGSLSVNATVRLANPVPGFDQAPVAVNITDQSAHGVLAVPINALVALAGGGYGVWLVDHGNRRLVGVHTGLFSDTMVQVSGTGLAAGMTVEVPTS